MKTMKTNRLFLKTLALTTIIFIVGIVVGYSFDDFRSSDILGSLQESELDTQSYIIEKEFFDVFGGYNCETAPGRLSAFSEELGELGYHLLNFEDKSLFKQGDYDYLLRKYFLSQMRTYALFNEVKKTCKLDTALILYFFKIGDSNSELQGKILDVFVKKYPNVAVFSLNVDYEGDPLAETVRNYYNVENAPTLIINDEVKVQGLVAKEELEAFLRGEYPWEE